MKLPGKWLMNWQRNGGIIMKNERNDRIYELIDRINELVYAGRDEIPSKEMADIIVALSTTAGIAIGNLVWGCDNHMAALEKISDGTFKQMKVEAKKAFEKIRRFNEAAGEMADEMAEKRKGGK